MALIDFLASRTRSAYPAISPCTRAASFCSLPRNICSSGDKVLDLLYRGPRHALQQRANVTRAILPNSGRRDCSRLSCGVEEMQPGQCQDLGRRSCAGRGSSSCNETARVAAMLSRSRTPTPGVHRGDHREWRASLPKRKSTNPPANSCGREVTLPISKCSRN